MHGKCARRMSLDGEEPFFIDASLSEVRVRRRLREGAANSSGGLEGGAFGGRRVAG